MENDGAKKKTQQLAPWIPSILISSNYDPISERIESIFEGNSLQFLFCWQKQRKQQQ